MDSPGQNKGPPSLFVQYVSQFALLQPTICTRIRTTFTWVCRWSRQECNQCRFHAYSSTVKTETADSSETSVSTYKTTRRYISEDRNFRRGNLNTRMDTNSLILVPCWSLFVFLLLRSIMYNEDFKPRPHVRSKSIHLT
jgi:hypothetical protein